MEIDFKDSILGAERDITLPGNRVIHLKIPAGIREGQKLRLAAKSTQGGDLYIQIKIKPSNIYRREGNDIHIEIPVTLAEAILGGEIEVPAIEGPISVSVPKGASSGTKLRIKGRGAPIKSLASERGNLLVTVKVVLPKQIDSELEESIRKWSEHHSYNPRSNLGGSP